MVELTRRREIHAVMLRDTVPPLASNDLLLNSLQRKYRAHEQHIERVDFCEACQLPAQFFKRNLAK